MALTFLTKENCIRICDGPPHKVLLAALHTGLGTTVHALPAISQLISEGYEVTVNCKEFQRPIYEAIGCQTITIGEPFGLSWYMQHGRDYGKVVSLATWDQWQQWLFGKNISGTIEAFADILGTTLPEEFSWRKTFEVEDVEDDYILFAPNALERWRTLPKEVADQVEEGLREFGTVIRLEGTECPDWGSLCSLISRAAYVVGVESGILNIAGSLNKKMLALIGMTEVETTIEQYRKYLPDLEYRVVKGFQPEGCAMPCMRQRDRGFFNDRCLGKHNLPQCLSHLNIQNVLEEFSLLIKGVEQCL